MCDACVSICVRQCENDVCVINVCEIGACDYYVFYVCVCVRVCEGDVCDKCVCVCVPVCVPIYVCDQCVYARACVC